MADFFGKGIGVAAGFDLGAAAPLDTRTVVTNMEELQAHIDGGRAYEGMLVYVEELGKTVIVKKQAEGEGFETEEFGFNQEKFDEGIAEVKQGVEDLKSNNELIKERLDTLEGLVVGGEGEGLQSVIGDVTDLKAVVGDETNGLVADINAAEGRLDAVEAKDAEQDTAIQEAKEQAGQAIANAAGAVAQLGEAKGELEAADKAMKDRLDIIEAIQHHDHENKDVLDGITAEKVSAWDGAEQAAKDYADQQIAALVSSAPEAMDTLGELASAIGAHQNVYDAYVAEVANSLAGKVDKVEGSRLVSEEEAAKWEAKAEVADVEAAEQAAEQAVSNLQSQIDALKGDSSESVTDQIGAVKEELQGAIDGVQAEATSAQQAAEAAQGKIDALEEVVGVPAKDAESATGIFAEIDALKANDIAINEKDAAQDTRLAAIEEMMGLGGGEGDTSALEQFANDISGLKSAVGAPAEDETGATGLFADIANLQARDGELQGSIDSEVQRATAEEQRIAGLVERLTSRVDGNDDAIAKAQVDIEDVQDKLNKNAEADGQLEGRMTALEGAVGVPAEDETVATGIFAEIAALKAKDDELKAEIGTPAQGEEVPATGLYKHIDDLHVGVANTFLSIKSEIKEDGKLYTSIGDTAVSTTEVAVMDQEDIDTVLADILADEQA